MQRSRRLVRSRAGGTTRRWLEPSRGARHLVPTGSLPATVGQSAPSRAGLRSSRIGVAEPPLVVQIEQHQGLASTSGLVLQPGFLQLEVALNAVHHLVADLALVAEAARSRGAGPPAARGPAAGKPASGPWRRRRPGSRRELLATGETARKRTVGTSDQLTAQEAVIARLAKDGRPIRRSAPGWSSVPGRSSTTWGRCSPSWTSAPVPSWTGPCPATRPAPGRSGASVLAETVLRGSVTAPRLAPVGVPGLCPGLGPPGLLLAYVTAGGSAGAGWSDERQCVVPVEDPGRPAL